MINEYTNINTTVPKGSWFFVWNADTNQVMSPPMLSDDYSVFCPRTLVIADTLEECDSYIHAHEFTYMMDYIVRPDHTLENPTDMYTNIKVEDYLANLDTSTLPPIEDIAPIAPIDQPAV
jgi:hypothetical protein